jgi:hypothetical protein
MIGEVPIVRLDDFMMQNNLPAPDLIKIDTQGSEARILASLPFVLQKNPRTIVFAEFWPHGMRSVGSSPEDFLAIIEANDIEMRDTVAGLPLLTKEQVIGKTPDTHFINLLLSAGGRL